MSMVEINENGVNLPNVDAAKNIVEALNELTKDWPESARIALVSSLVGAAAGGALVAAGFVLSSKLK